jgi:signal peptidase II
VEVFLKRYVRDYLFLIIPAAIIIIMDQWTKWLVSTNLDYGEMWAPWHWLLPYVRIIHYSNTGSAFGLFQGFGNVFMVLAILVSVFILYYFPRVERKEWVIRLALTLQLAGAVGNLIDRLRQGFVTDFISVGNFAVFNIADSCISVGTVILLIGMYFYDKREQQAALDNGNKTGEELGQPFPEDSHGE